MILLPVVYGSLPRAWWASSRKATCQSPAWISFQTWKCTESGYETLYT